MNPVPTPGPASPSGQFDFGSDDASIAVAPSLETAREQAAREQAARAVPAPIVQHAVAPAAPLPRFNQDAKEPIYELRTLSILVENKPGVLNRVTQLFSRRDFNIRALAVGVTSNPKRSRITVEVRAESAAFEQIFQQVAKVVNVLKVAEMRPEDSVSRRLILVKVRADDTNRSQVLEIVNLFRASVVDVHPTSVVVQAVGQLAKLEALLVALEPYGIKELAQSGAVALGRGPEILAGFDAPSADK